MSAAYEGTVEETSQSEQEEHDHEPGERCGAELITDFDDSDIEEIGDYLHDKLGLTSLDTWFEWNDTSATINLRGEFPNKKAAGHAQIVPVDSDADEAATLEETPTQRFIRLRDREIAIESADFGDKLRAFADKVTPDVFCDLYADLCHLFEFITHNDDLTLDDLLEYDPAQVFPMTSSHARAFGDIVFRLLGLERHESSLELIAAAKENHEYRKNSKSAAA